MIAVAACDRGPAQAGDAAADSVSPEDVSAEALRAAVTDPRVKAFYEARQWRAAWNEDQARELTEALRDASRHGMDAAQFLREGDAAADPAAREASLSLAAVAYADALANGRVDPKEIFEIYTVPMPEVDIAAGLNQAIGEGNVGAWLASLAPQDAEYKALSEAFLSYSQQAAKSGASSIADGEPIGVGDRDPRVPQIAQALRVNGYLRGEAPTEGDGALYTQAMADAVKRLQQSFGLSADGVVGNDTLEVLNAGAAERARTLAINLERRRWLERNPPKTRIDVNTAAAFLTYLRDGNHRHTARTVVGQPGWETPQLGSPIFRLVANPNWTVPKSIAEEEILPKGPGYLRANNMVMRDGWVVQRSGPESALGLVKFDMENPHAIYLHDTPAKSLFQQNERHSSHGCVRVQDAVGFARMLAGDAGVSDEFAKAMAKNEETFVKLPNKIPVRLLYHTAYVADGRVLFRTDAYGWDERVAGALGMETREARKVQTHVSVAGP